MQHNYSYKTLLLCRPSVDKLCGCPLIF